MVSAENGVGHPFLVHDARIYHFHLILALAQVGVKAIFVPVR